VEGLREELYTMSCVYLSFHTQFNSSLYCKCYIIHQTETSNYFHVNIAELHS